MVSAWSYNTVGRVDIVNGKNGGGRVRGGIDLLFWLEICIGIYRHFWFCLDLSKLDPKNGYG